MSERFTLLSELGRGGMGVVWKARDEQTGQIVALKVMREIYAEDADYVARFERELELAKRINSAFVVKVLGFGVRQKVPYLALEYVDGPSLHDALARHGPYSWPEARVLLVQLAQGLADAHAAGVIHRDVKPSNVLIGPDGVAKLTDFGIARGLDTTRMTATSTMIGTPAYLAPEGPKDARSDLYSLGIIGYQLLTGAPPFVGQTYQEVLLAHIRDEPDLSRLPAETRAIISWLLAKEPAKRARNAWEVIPVLEGRLFLTAPAPQTAAKAAAVAASTAKVGPAAAPKPTPAPAPAAAPARTPARASALRREPALPLRPGVLLPLPPGRAADILSPWTMTTTEIKGASSIDARVWHTATPLPTGRILFAGGSNVESPLSTAELFSPAAGTISRARNMKSARVDHAAASLQDGCVLICGGNDGEVIASAEVYDFRTGGFRTTQPMTIPRQLHTATLLTSGQVLIAGGWDGEQSLANCEVYDPNTSEFHRAATMSEPRESHTATVLADGRLLVVGGECDGQPIATVEICDPGGTRAQKIASMEIARGGHTATLLRDGTVLITGGVEGEYESRNSAEIYDPKADLFRPIAPMRLAREGHTATPTPHGIVLIVGGEDSSGVLASVEAYDPQTGCFFTVGKLKRGRVDHSATLLADGRVLVAGGLGRNGQPLDSIELLDIEYRA